jgi:hypothetical protein
LSVFDGDQEAVDAVGPVDAQNAATAIHMCYGRGSDSFPMQDAGLDRQRNQSGAEELHPGPPVHLSLERLQTIELSLDRPVAPAVGHRRLHRENVPLQPRLEVLDQRDTAGARTIHPLVQRRDGAYRIGAVERQFALDGLAQILHEMEPVADLPGRGGGPACGLGVAAVAVPTNRVDVRMRHQPLLDGFCGVIIEHVDTVCRSKATRMVP